MLHHIDKSIKPHVCSGSYKRETYQRRISWNDLFVISDVAVPLVPTSGIQSASRDRAHHSPPLSHTLRIMCGDLVKYSCTKSFAKDKRKVRIFRAT